MFLFRSTRYFDSKLVNPTAVVVRGTLVFALALEPDSSKAHTNKLLLLASLDFSITKIMGSLDPLANSGRTGDSSRTTLYTENPLVEVQALPEEVNKLTVSVRPEAP